MALLVGAIADDDTGATDLAGMLTEQGMRVIVATEDADANDLQGWSADADAIIIGTASRSISKSEAYVRTAAAAKALLALAPQRLAIKYCSTFDSTAEGNIGASIDAAMDVTGERFTVALPALPALGRTTYMGYHFVADKLLSDSALRHHPLNPMHNSHLPSHLSTQTKHRVASVNLQAISSSEYLAERIQELRNEGVGIAVIDCIDEEDLQEIGEAIADLPLITGSSAWAMVLPAIWRKREVLSAARRFDPPFRFPGGTGYLIVSGSCSPSTRAQNAWAVKNGCGIVVLPTAALLDSDDHLEDLIDQASDILRQGGVCLVSTTAVGIPTTTGSTTEQQTRFSPSLSVSIAHKLSSMIVEVVARCPPQGLIVAGGETSSSLMRRLRLGGLRVGPSIDPGVPLCVALARPNLAVALKSGNFGSENFYGKAIQAMNDLPIKKATS